MKNPFDRAAENLGNITGLEHVNVEIPDQGPASDFYLMGCGFTRDPYLFPGTNNMWVNIGKTQFHLPAGDPLVLRGAIGIVTPDTAAGIAKFYRKIFDAPAKVEGNGGGKVARVTVGKKQEFHFRETDKPIPEYDGHHLQVYVKDFAGPHDKLAKLDLITEESDRCQYRWEDIVDLDSGKVLFQIEHEIRSMTHPLYFRHLNLVNRNPAQ